jgi:PAS domain S-box-containing protein
MMIPTESTPIRLLLIENDPADRLACRRVFEEAGSGFALIEAETATEGLRLAHTEAPDCILLGHGLPDFSGLEFLADLGEANGCLPVPVVMLAAADDASVTLCALKRGASDYVIKDALRETWPWLPAVVIRVLRERRMLIEKERAVEELGRAEAQYRALAEQVPAIVYRASLDEPAKFLYVSPQIRQLGYAPEDWLEDPEALLKRIHPEDRDRVVEALARTYGHHAPLRCEYRLVKPDGRTCWIRDEADVVRDEAGGGLFLQGVLVDRTEDRENRLELDYYRRRLEERVAQRTEELEQRNAMLRSANAHMDLELCERKQVEAALRAGEARFRMLLDAAGAGIVGLDAGGTCHFANPAAAELLGCLPEDLVGRNLPEAFRQRSTQGAGFLNGDYPLQRTLTQGLPCRFADTLHRDDGLPVTAEFTGRPVWTDERPSGAVVLIRKLGEARTLSPWLPYEVEADGENRLERGRPAIPDARAELRRANA